MRILPCALALAAAFAAPAEAQCFMADLETTQVVPPPIGSGGGLGFFRIDRTSNTLFYDLTFVGSGLTETVSHIHGYAPPGSNAPVVHVFRAGDNKTGTWTYAESQEADLLAGLAYVDVHTLANPAGHLRGQIIPDTSDAMLYGRTEGDQVVPPCVGCGQTGVVILRLDTTADVMTQDYFIYPVTTTFGTHLRGYVPPGQNGGYLSFLFNGLTATWSYPDADEYKILAGLTYAENYYNFGGIARAQMNLMCQKDPPATSYCTAGTSANGCRTRMSAIGAPSATAPVGFRLQAAGAPGLRNGIFFFGINGQQAKPWGNGSSFQCVVPPVSRAGLMVGEGSAQLCNGSFTRDLNARWCPTCPKASQNPGAGAVVDAQLWYRDPNNTSNQVTSLSDAIEFAVGP